MALPAVRRTYRTTRYTRYLLRQGGVDTAPQYVALEERAARFFADAREGSAVNYQRYVSYVVGAGFAGGAIPRAVFNDDYERGIRVVRMFAELFDPANEFGFVVNRESLITSDALGSEQVSVANGLNWNPQPGDPIAIRWDGGADSITVGGLTVNRGQVYPISSVAPQPNAIAVRIAPGGTKTSNQTVALTNGRVMYGVWKNIEPYVRSFNLLLSIQRAIDAGLWVIVTPWGSNWWDHATAQAGESFRDHRTRLGFGILYRLNESWCDYVTANVNDPDNRLILEWQNEDVANSADYPTAEALSKPIREPAITGMRAHAPNKLLMAGGARWSDPASLGQIVPQDDPGLIYKVHKYFNSSDVAAEYAPALAWRETYNRDFFVAEYNRLNDSDATTTTRRTQHMAVRDGLRALGLPGPCYWHKAVGGANDQRQRMADIVGETMVWLPTMLPVIDERPIVNVGGTISGTPQVGQTLTFTPSTWWGRGPITVTRQWLCDGVAIPGATGTTYVLGAGDQGCVIRVYELAENVLGVAERFSSETDPINNPPLDPPVNAGLPTISGVPQVGFELVASPGSWTGAPPITYAYQWQRGATDIAGATASSYVAQAADAGQTLRVVVTATNGEGSAAATSASTAEIAPAPDVPEGDTGAAWVAKVSMTVVAQVGSGLILNSPLHVLDPGADATVATANGFVSSIASVSPGTRPFLQATAGRQPTHVAASDIISFVAASSTDAAGDFLASETDAGSLARLLGDGISPNSQRGVAYLLFRFPSAPTWRTCLFGGGTPNNTFADERNGTAFVVTETGALRIWRADISTVSAAQTSGTVVANVWHAAAFIWNDDRVTAGVSTNIARLRVKSKAGGNFTEMASIATGTAKAWGTSSNNPRARIGRAPYDAAGQMGTWDLRLFAVDLVPTSTDAIHESNLNWLLSLV